MLTSVLMFPGDVVCASHAPVQIQAHGADKVFQNFLF